jgi:23S rRNA (pseudouridine1915-N3)-methyltransferase
MKILLASVGKQSSKEIIAITDDFTKRLQKYFTTDWAIISPAKKATLPNLIKQEEAQHILQLLTKDDYLVLLDETGKMISSPELGALIEATTLLPFKRIVFLIGGAYGVDKLIQNRAHYIWSLSKLVFPHMLVRCILAEQIYRACTILKNEKYHHI